MAEVNTVRGQIDAEKLGVTLMHEHLMIVDNSMRKCFFDWFDEEAFVRSIRPVMERCKANGIETLVDLTNINMGRDVRLCKRVADECGINIIVSTGLYYTEEPWQTNKSAEIMADYFCRDIEEGCEGTDIKAGIIKCATDSRGITSLNANQLKASALCANRTGVPIYTHTIAKLKTGLDQIKLFDEMQTDLSKVVIGHIGDTNDLDYVEELLRSGVYIGLDRFGSEFLWAERDRIDNLIELIDRGWIRQLILSHDMPYYYDWGENSFQKFLDSEPFDRPVLYTHIHESVIPKLKERGVSDAEIHTMLVENPARVFSGRQ